MTPTPALLAARIAGLIPGLIPGRQPRLGITAPVAPDVVHDVARQVLHGVDHTVGRGWLLAADMAGSDLAAGAVAGSLLTRLLPLVYGACFLALLWQAFRIMGRGYGAVPRPGDQPRMPVGDRTGRVTIHPELLDADGQLTRDDLLTVRFSGDHEEPASPDEPG